MKARLSCGHACPWSYLTVTRASGTVVPPPPVAVVTEQEQFEAFLRDEDGATEVCPHGCSAPYGACVDGACVCEPGWSGPECDLPSFKECPNNCTGHGICDWHTGKCECRQDMRWNEQSEACQVTQDYISPDKI